MGAGATGGSEPGDHAALGLAVGAALAWVATGATGSLIMAVATAGLLTVLTAVSTFTALAPPPSTLSSRALAGVAAAVVAAVFVVAIDRAWSWMLPTILLAVGMRAPRSRPVRLVALSVSTLMLLAAWTLALL